MIKKEEGSKREFKSGKCEILPRLEGKFSCVFAMQPKGELGGPGKFVNQDRLVANTQGSSSLNYYWPSRHEGFSTT